MPRYKRVYVGRGIKPIEECPKCGESGYLTAQWSARENTMTWCGAYFSVQHQDIRHYIGIELREQYPKLGKTPPSIEWMQQYRIEKGYASIESYKDQAKKKQYLQSLRVQIRQDLMSLRVDQLKEILGFMHTQNGVNG